MRTGVTTGNGRTCHSRSWGGTSREVPGRSTQEVGLLIGIDKGQLICIVLLIIDDKLLVLKTYRVLSEGVKR